MDEQVRMPAAAGQFYPSDKQSIIKILGSFGIKNGQRQEAIGCMLPHAGYIYSAEVACNVLNRINIPKTIIILGPNHTGLGEAFSIMHYGIWRTPFGDIKINSALVDALLADTSYLTADTAAHRFEHSIEVQLPIIQYYQKDFSFVPIIIGAGGFNDYQKLANEIADSIKKADLTNRTLIIASSDMTHYEDAESARMKDRQAIDAILELDEVKLWDNIKKYDITMCGYAPAIVMISAAKALGAQKAELIQYKTSGDTTGDNTSVVGYAGIMIT